MEEQRMLTKVDNVLSSVRFPWEKKTTVLPRPQPLGAFRIHKVDPATGAWQLTCSVSTEAGVVCLALQEHTRTLYTGMDDGSVLAHRIGDDWADAETVKELRNLHAPKSRVTALWLHRKKDYLLSTSRDKQLAIYDIRKDLVLSTTAVGAAVNAAAWISALEVDEDSEIAFVGTYSTFIHIVDIADATNPRMLHTLQGHTGSVRCLQYRPLERYLFSGGFDGHACIWSINPTSAGGPRDALMRSRAVGWLKEAANEKVKSVVFVPPVAGANNEDKQGLVAVGQDGGHLSFFSVATGRMKFALRAHQNNVVRLIFLEGARVLISASLDGSVKFWTIPSQASPVGERPSVAAIAAKAVEGAMATAGVTPASASQAAGAAAAAVSTFFRPAAASSSSSSSSSATVRKDSVLGPSAPPPSMASSSTLHKSSRADSTDGTTVSARAL
jgi:WD40 repeat protein